MAKKKYTVQTPVRHDGKDYAPGDSIDLDIPDDHSLIANGDVSGGKAVKAAPVKLEAPVVPPVPDESQPAGVPSSDTQEQGA